MKVLPKNKTTALLIFLVIVYLLYHCFTLNYFPFAHSDEVWLASLSRTMLLSADLSATEDFFHITPRYPHGIKILFHILQFPFVIISYSLWSVRLFSLLCGIGTIIYMIRLGRLLIPGRGKFLFLIPALLLGLDIQFFYISHLARQESLLLFLLVFTLDYFFRHLKNHKYRNDIFLGIVSGLAIGIHPNSFIIAIPVALLYLFFLIPRKKERENTGFRNFLLWSLILFCFTLFFLALSRIFEPSFPAHYLEFGAAHGVTDSFLLKILKLPRFYGKMFHQVGGTYYLPDIRFQLILFGISSFVSLFFLLFAKGKGAGEKGVKEKKQRIAALLIVLLGINLGIFLIGKYSPPSIIFIFPPALLLIGILLASITEWIPVSGRKVLFKICRFLIVSLIVTVSILTIHQISPWGKISYNRYRQTISEHVPPGVPVLANLNTGFAFADNQLHAWRDLKALSQAGKTFEEYIRENGIQYIVYSDEMDVIYEQRPVWNDLYGNIYCYYEEMTGFFSAHCELTASFKAPVYGMRITQYMNTKPFRIRIYQVGVVE